MIKIHLDGCFRRNFKSSFSREPQYAICCEIPLGFDILLTFHQVKKLRTGKWRFTYWKKPSWGAKKHPWAHGEDMLPPNFPSPTWCPLGKRSKKELVGCCLFRDTIIKVKIKSCRGSFGMLPHSPDAFKKATALHPEALIKQGMIHGDTPRKPTWNLTRMVFQKESPLPGVHFQVPC